MTNAERVRERTRTLADIRTLLLDMDGVIYFGGGILTGVNEFLRFLRQEGIRFAFVTNGANRWPEDHRAALAARGIDVGDVPIITAGVATARYLAEQHPGSRVYVIGGEGLRRQLVEVGGCALDAECPDYVVVGWTADFDYDKLSLACRAIHRGARLILADPDVNDPGPEFPSPGSGAFGAAIQAATGAPCLAIGKPNRIMLDAAMHELEADVATAAIVGDRLDADIKGGKALGIGTILVLTGITTPEMVARSPLQPDWVVRDLPELHARWRDELRGRASPRA